MLKNNLNSVFLKILPWNAKTFDTILLKYWGLSGAKTCKYCRSRQELSNEFLLAKSASIQPRTSLSKLGGKFYSLFIRLLLRTSQRRVIHGRAHRPAAVGRRPYADAIVGREPAPRDLKQAACAKRRAKSDTVLLDFRQALLRRTWQGSFSAVSKPNFASQYALESSRRDLHNALLCTVLESNPKKRGSTVLVESGCSKLNFLFENR